MAKRTHSLKRLMTGGGTVRPMEEQNFRVPRYVTWKPKFSCPLSPGILWFHGLVYNECPLVDSERDMDECADCPLRAENTQELILKRQRDDKKRRRRKKDDRGKNKGSRSGHRRPPRKNKADPQVVVKRGKSYVSP